MADDARVPGAAGGARRVDAAALRHVRDRLWRAEAAPWLHGEVARRMAERLPVIKRQPAVVIDWWARLGASGDLLAAAYPASRRIEVWPDDAPAGAEAAAAAPGPWWLPRRWRAGVRDAPPREAIAESVLAPGSGELLWANMMLHAVPDPPAAMRAWQRALAVDGFLMFSTLGPGSLAMLRELYRERGWPSPHAPFVDMHDLGDMLVEAGFADPVMDQETVTLTWPDARALLAELRALGGNAAPARPAGLRTPRWRGELAAALAERADAAGRIALEFEIVYGHAFRPPPRARVAAETRVSVQDLRTIARSGRRPPG